jgi:hypothetical protein
MATKSTSDPMTVEVEGDTLVIRIDLTSDQGLSSSGKSRIVASTHGNMLVGNGVKLGLNCYRPV